MSFKKNENLIFWEYCLNMKNSVAIIHRPSKFGMCLHEIKMEGRVSQNSDLGPSFCFMKCRNVLIKKLPKVTRFLT